MIHIVTGPVNSGKTSFLNSLIDSKNKSSVWDGFLTSKLFSHSIHTGYEILHINTKEKTPLCYKIDECPEDWDEVCRTGMFSFSEKAFQYGNKIISELASHTKQYNIILDEAGPLEIEGKGFFSAVNMLVQQNASCWISVRDVLLKDFINTFSITDYEIISMEDSNDKP